MGNDFNREKYNMSFQDMQHVLKHSESFVLINTLLASEQRCILPNTVSPQAETDVINELLKNGKKETTIVVYGKNCNDFSVIKKQEQLKSLGFLHIYVYLGGMFEWLLLQDIYSDTEFPTTNKELDILKFKAERKIMFH